MKLAVNVTKVELPKSNLVTWWRNQAFRRHNLKFFTNHTLQNSLTILGFIAFTHLFEDDDDHSSEAAQGRRVSHSVRFSAAFHNSRADTPWSSSCEINEPRGRPEMRLQSLPGLVPLRLPTLSRRAAYACVLGSRRWTCSKSEWRFLAIISTMFESLERHWTSMFWLNHAIGCRESGADRSRGTPGLADYLS